MKRNILALTFFFAVAPRTSPVADSSSMKIPLEGARARWSFFVGILLIAGSLAFVAGKTWLAAHWGASWDPDRLLRAASLEPADADYWDRLGLYEKWNFELRRVVVHYQRYKKFGAWMFTRSHLINASGG